MSPPTLVPVYVNVAWPEPFVTPEPVPGFAPVTANPIVAPETGAPPAVASVNVAVTVCESPASFVALAGVRASWNCFGSAPGTQLTPGFGTNPTTRLSRKTAESRFWSP